MPTPDESLPLHFLRPIFLLDPDSCNAQIFLTRTNYKQRVSLLAANLACQLEYLFQTTKALGVPGAHHVVIDNTQCLLRLSK